MAESDYIGTLDANFKQVYAPKMEDLRTENDFLYNNIKFATREKLGDEYIQPVIVTGEHGFTFADADDDAYDLNQAVGMVTQTAKVKGYQTTLRTKFGVKQVAKALSAGKEAFIATTGLKVKNMSQSAIHMLEMQMLYGRSGIAEVESAVAGSGNSTAELQITNASWAPGIWCGKENSFVNCFNSTTMFGIAGVAPAYGTADLKVTAVDYDNYKITVSGNASIIASIVTFANTAGNTVNLYWKGAYGVEMYGIDYIISNTGTLFNIDAATYGLFKGHTVAINGVLTVDKVIKSVGKAIGKGGLNEKVDVLVNPDTWLYLASELSSKSNMNIPYKIGKGEYGFQALQTYTMAGEMEIVSHNCVKKGDAFILPIKRFKRIGSHDVTFEIPGQKEKFFRLLENSNAYELRCWVDQAVFTECPAKLTKLTGITVTL